MAFLAAATVTAVVTRSEPTGSPRLRHAGPLATALGLDMTRWWRPSPEGFGQRISKATLANALTKAAEDGFAIRVRATKKVDAAPLALPVLIEAG